LTWSVLVTTGLALLQVTSLGALLVLTAGVGGIGSGVFLVRRLIWHADPTEHAPTKGGQYRSESGQYRVHPELVKTRPESFSGPSADSSRSFRPLDLGVPFLSAILLLLISAALVIYSVMRASEKTTGIYGLLPTLGLPFYAAVAITIAAIMIALRYVRTAWPAAVLGLGILLVEFNGVPMFLAATPLGNLSTYEHFGVVDYILHGGALNDQLDAYQQWPGFFAVSAGLVRISGRSDLTYSNWAQLFFEALNALAVFGIARRFSRQHQAIPYMTVLIFEVITWEGQYYYAPQTLALTLALLFFFFLLPLLEPNRLRNLPFIRTWDKTSLRYSGVEARPLSRNRRTALAIALVAIFTAISVTHQLSPYFVFISVAALWVIGASRSVRLGVTLLIVLFGYPLLHLSAVEHDQLLSGFSFSNSVSGYQTQGPVTELADRLSRIIGLGTWLVTAICCLSYRRRFGIVAIPAVLALAPFSLILLGNYGGEGINRIFLFSSPWCALIIAIRVRDMSLSPALRLSAIGLSAFLAGMGSAQVQDFGLFTTNLIAPSEIQASAYFLDHAPKNSMLVLAIPDFPSRVNGQYVLHDTTETVNDPILNEVSNCDAPESEAISSITPQSCHFRTDPEVLAKTVASLAGGVGFLAFAPSMDSYLQYEGSLPPSSLTALVPRLEASDYWKLWYDEDGTIIFEAIPNGRGISR
jgi:hypothetical protein